MGLEDQIQRVADRDHVIRHLMEHDDDADIICLIWKSDGEEENFGYVGTSMSDERFIFMLEHAKFDYLRAKCAEEHDE